MPDTPQLNRPTALVDAARTGGPDSTARSGHASVAHVRDLSQAECFQLLLAATVGRIGFVAPIGLQIIPVNYRLGAGNRIFVRVGARGVLAELADRNSHVAFEVDYHASDFGSAWSILMQGRIRRLDHAAQLAYAELRRPPVPWPGGDKTLTVQFLPSTVTGRGLQRSDPN